MLAAWSLQVSPLLAKNVVKPLAPPPSAGQTLPLAAD